MSKPPRTRRPLAIVIACGLAALLVAACGDDGATTTEAVRATTEAPTTTAASNEVEPGELTVTAVDYGFEGLPASVPAGTAVILENTSDAELHELVAIRLPDDETRSIDELMQLPQEELAAFFPFVETVVIAPPGAAGVAVEGTGALSDPGRYALICAIPTGADPAAYMAAAAEAEGGPPEVPGGPPHFVVGMYAELTVEG